MCNMRRRYASLNLLLLTKYNVWQLTIPRPQHPSWYSTLWGHLRRFHRFVLVALLCCYWGKYCMDVAILTSIVLLEFQKPEWKSCCCTRSDVKYSIVPHWGHSSTRKDDMRLKEIKWDTKKKMPHDKVTVSKAAAAVANNKVTRKCHIDH